MIELPEAMSLIELAAAPLPPRRMPLLEACGRVLAAGIVSDVDSPPWDRAMMDGFAVRSDDFSAGAQEVVELDVAVDLAAGDVTTLKIARGTCARHHHSRRGGPLFAGSRGCATRTAVPCPVLVTVACICVCFQAAGA